MHGSHSGPYEADAITSPRLGFEPGPAVEVAGVEVAGVAGGAAEDDDDARFSLARAVRDEAGAGRIGRAGLHAAIALDIEQFVRVLPDDVPLVAARARDGRASAAGAGDLTEEGEFQRGPGQQELVAGAGEMLLVGEAVRVGVLRVGHAEGGRGAVHLGDEPAIGGIVDGRGRSR